MNGSIPADATEIGHRRGDSGTADAVGAARDPAESGGTAGEAWKTVAAERRSTLAEAREDLERTMVRDAFGRHGTVARAVGELGVARQGLSKLMACRQVDRFDPMRDRSAQAPSR